MTELADLVIKTVGLVGAYVHDDELWACCPNPGHDDENPSWSLSLTNGGHHCFSCGYSGHVIRLLVDHGMTYGLAKLRWAREGQGSIGDRAVEIRYPITEDMVAPWQGQVAREVVARVGTWTVPTLYRVGMDPETGRAAFVTRDRGGRPTGVWVATHRKYLLLGPADAKSRGALFGAHVRPSPRTVVVEGFYQAMAVAMHTGLKGVATMGTSVTDSQLEELCAMAPLTILMDGDRAGQTARDALMARIPRGVEVYAAGGHVGDPDDMSPRDLWTVIGMAKSRRDYERWLAAKEVNSDEGTRYRRG